MLPNKERSTDPLDGLEGAAAALRASALVASLRNGDLSAEEVFAAFDELDRLPPTIVQSALGDWTGPAPDPDRLDDATRQALRLPPRPLRLRVVAVVRDADLLDLGTIAEEQIRLAGKSWDGVDRDAIERLDGEVDGSFAGTLVRRSYADASAPGGPDLVEVLFFAGDAALVFRAGTTEVVGRISDGVLEMPDRRLRSALADAFGLPDPAPRPAPPSSLGALEEPEESEELEEAEPPESAAARPSSKRPKAASAKKKTAAKKRAPKKVAAEAKPSAKKKAAAKTATKKASTAKAGATKKAAAKTATKKAAAAAPKKKKTSAVSRTRRTGRTTEED